MPEQLGLIPLPAEDQALADEADAFSKARDMLAAAKESFEIAKTRLVAHFPEDPGEHVRTVGPHTVTVKRGEKWSWDSDELEKMFASVPLPDYIKTRYSVHKADFEKLSAQERADIAAALTKGIGAATVTVVTAP